MTIKQFYELAKKYGFLGLCKCKTCKCKKQIYSPVVYRLHERFWTFRAWIVTMQDQQFFEKLNIPEQLSWSERLFVKQDVTGSIPVLGA